eukprot:gnl/MRDRNA2_/MRDRNA2_31884_c0_seq1.p1 gnl/MRDRNA2_/MRDRNA2_31884_c0~~gnl/MRDRNA2_/MRDRNA2_31884_c0_seq1.p1  ORF type:complete len:1408 (+),score=273.93 gnl/MRDRNA2_/MRDRNA2_31884_c0_seq1:200-4225(+)
MDHQVQNIASAGCVRNYEPLSFRPKLRGEYTDKASEALRENVSRLMQSMSTMKPHSGERRSIKVVDASSVHDAKEESERKETSETRNDQSELRKAANELQVSQKMRLAAEGKQHEIEEKLQKTEEQLRSAQKELEKLKLHRAVPPSCQEVSSQPASSSGSEETQPDSWEGTEANPKLVRLFRGDMRPVDNEETACLWDRVLQWDLVIALPNPDHPDVPSGRVTCQEAKKTFERTFSASSGRGGNEQKVEENSFMEAFRRLRPAGKGNDEYPQTTAIAGPCPAMCRSHGGSFVSTDAGSAFEHSKVPDLCCGDFLSLIRNTLVTKLSHMIGLTVELVFSQKYGHIYLLVAADEEDLMAHAERTRFPMAVNLLHADPDAFEPCERDYRETAEAFFCFAGNYDDVKSTQEKLAENANEAKQQPKIGMTLNVDYQKLSAHDKDELKSELRDTLAESAGVDPSMVSVMLKDLQSSKSVQVDADIRGSDAAWQKSINKSRTVKRVAEAANVIPGVQAAASSVTGKLEVKGFEVKEASELTWAPREVAEALDSQFKRLKARGEEARRRQAEAPSGAGVGDLEENRNYRLPEDPGDVRRDVYLTYLQKRLERQIPIRAIYEANDEHKPPDERKLRCLWDYLGIKAPITKVRAPYDTRPGIPWLMHQTETISGRAVESHFSPSDRLQLLMDMISRQVDLPHLVGLNLIVDYFPMCDDTLRAAALIPSIRFLLEDPAPGGPISSKYKSGKDGQAGMAIRLPPKAKKKGFVAFMRRIFQEKSEDIYFGQQIALYFTFMRHFASWLVLPALFGFIFQLSSLFLPDNDVINRDTVVLLNALFLTIWAPLWLTSWTRRQDEKLLEWGFLGYNGPSLPQTARMQFWGKVRNSPITGKDGEIYDSGFMRSLRFSLSFCVSLVTVVIVMATVALCSAARVYFYEYCVLPYFNFNFSQNVVGVVNAIQIILFNKMYGSMAHWLTSHENHETYQGFVSAYASKTIMFQFINSFSSLFYTAFLKEWLETKIFKSTHDLCAADGVSAFWGSNCYMGLMNKQLSTLLIVFCAKNAFELGSPMLKVIMKKKSEKATRVPKSEEEATTGYTSERSEKSQDTYQSTKSSTEGTHADISNLVRRIDHEFMQPPYGQPWLAYDGSVDDYSELIVMFGFLVFFSITFPFAGVLVLFSCVLEIVVDSYKMEHLVRRPLPRMEVSVGVWLQVFNCMIWLAILCNTSLLVFTAKMNNPAFLTLIFGEDVSDAVSWVFYCLVLGSAKGFVVLRQAGSSSDKRLDLAQKRARFSLQRLYEKGHQQRQKFAATMELADFQVKDPKHELPGMNSARWGFQHAGRLTVSMERASYAS